jgi:teichoic acid transport system permease protein
MSRQRRARRTSPAATTLRAMSAESPGASGGRVPASVLEHDGGDGTRPRPPAHREDEFTSEHHVYEPHRIGLPPIRPYVRELWRRRQFAIELSRTTLRAQHFKTALGQLWLVINPLMLTLVYFLLVDILRGGTRGATFFAHLMVGMFAFHFMTGAINQGAKSVVGSGRLVLNTAFPRTLLPLAAVRTAFMRFLPTVGVYTVVHVVSGLPIGPHLLWVMPIFLILTIFTAGVAMLAAAAQVYFRDVRSFLPYFNRIWMYATPVLYYLDEVPSRLRWIIDFNPLTPIFASLSDVANRGLEPNPTYLAWGLAWALVAFVAGALFFMSREREFAVRL